MGNGTLTTIVGAVIIAGSVYAADPWAALAGAAVYLGGIHAPRLLGGGVKRW